MRSPKDSNDEAILGKLLGPFAFAMLIALLLNTGGINEWIQRLGPGAQKEILDESASPLHSISESLGLTAPRQEIRSHFKSLQTYTFWWLPNEAIAQEPPAHQMQASEKKTPATSAHIGTPIPIEVASEPTASDVPERPREASHQSDQILNNAADQNKNSAIQKTERRGSPSTSLAKTAPQTSTQRVELTKRPPAVPTSLTKEGTPAAQNNNILIVGDSLMGGVGPQLKRLLRKEHNQSTPTLKWKSSTGLTRGDYFNWPKTLSDLLEKRSYNLVVAIFGTNDNQSVEHNRKILKYGTPEWFAFYRARVDEVLRIMCKDEQTRLIWVGLPRMRSKSFDRKIEKMNQLFKDEVASSRCGTYIPMSKYIAPDDAYTSYLKLSGKKTKVRASDGIHMTYRGNHFVAKSLAADIMSELKSTP